MTRARVLASLAFAAGLSACGGGGGGSTTVAQIVTPSPTTVIYAVPGPAALSTTDVQTVLAQAIAEAKSRNLPAVISVTDRVGDVLAVYAMAGAPVNVTLRPGATQNLDAQGLVVPAAAGAIAKAISGAYLSSGGNAFSTRTASMIVQQNFPPSPATVGLESGPLYGVQFSQLPCSDVNTRSANGSIGPKRSPLGLSADPGGFPLYKDGVLVGGVGVIADGDYGFDRNVIDFDIDSDELIALAATSGFDAPTSIRADHISLDGTLLRYSDVALADLRSNPVAAPEFGTLTASAGSLIAVTGYFAGVIVAGQAYGSESSGVRKANSSEFSDPDAFVLSDGAGNARYGVRGGTDGAEVTSPLTQGETRTLLEEAFKVMAHTRAQIRQPLNSRAQVSISVVDTRGAVLGLVRSPDAPIFGIDVSAQKARSAAFLSSPSAASDLAGNLDPSPTVRSDIAGFAAAVQTFLRDAQALNGKSAFSMRAIGNLARPYFPDGQEQTPSGPLSRPIAAWSPLSTGLQSALVISNLTGPERSRCTYLPDVGASQNRLQNGLQIFAGGVPIYRGTVLIGALGVSGDGIDQDDMIAFLGLANAATRTGTVKHADASIRADQLVINGVRLRYVNCPVAPFVDTSQQNVCQGL